jgi:Holliday junction DNA helicase RuvB
LLEGAAGCGKTTTAQLLAKELDTPFLSVVPNDMADRKSVKETLKKLNHDNYSKRGDRLSKIKPTILFFDEIHNMPLKGQELLGLVMERFILESDEPNSFWWVPYFTLVGATTMSGKLSKPFRDRFKLNFTFRPYKLAEMLEIVKMHNKRLGVRMLSSAVEEIAKRSRGTPRTAVGFIESVRDRLIAENLKIAFPKLVIETFEDMGIDKEGFTVSELKIMEALLDSGIPVGLENLSIITEEDKKTIREKYEPYLIRKGMILVSGKGRILTDKGRDYIRSSNHLDKAKFRKEEIPLDYKRK